MPEQPQSVFPSTSPRSFRPLPQRPDLAQLKKQAKELLRRYADAEPEAVEEVGRYFNPEPGKTSGGPLTLAEAQLALARSYGYDSWPKLKAYVEGVHKQAVTDAIRARDLDAVRAMLQRRPELAAATSGGGEMQMIHLAVFNDDASMVRLLMEHGADARRGIWPHRESTTALRMATERGLDRIVSVIHEVERERQESLSCPNVTVSPEQEQLAALIRSGQSDEAIAMLDRSPELVKQCDLDGATPLHIAAEVANEAIVDKLCDLRADARKLDANGHTPMDRAVIGCSWFKWKQMDVATRVIERLRRRGCEWTPLGAAAMGEVDVLRQMHRETPSILTDGFSYSRGGVMSAAVTFDQYDAVEALLDLGMDADEPIALGRQTDDEEAWSWGGPLWRAAAMNRLAIATLLLDRGADPNANVYASGWPLDRAYEKGHREMVNLLYERGAKPSPYTVCNAHDRETARRLFDERGDDAVWVRELVWSAACCTSLPIVEMALPRLMELREQLPPNEGGLASWHDLLCQPMRMADPNEHVRPSDYRPDDRFTILKMMLDAGIDANATGRFGLTTLHWIAARGGKHGGPEMSDADRNRFATLLLDAGADPSMRDTLLCSSALGWACRYGREALVNLLLERSVPVDEPEAEPWATPLAWAKKMGHRAIEDALVAAGSVES